MVVVVVVVEVVEVITNGVLDLVVVVSFVVETVGMFFVVGISWSKLLVSSIEFIGFS